MSIHAAIVQEEASAGGRGNERVRVLLETSGMTQTADRIRVLIHNLSISGLLLETQFDLALGQQFVIILPETRDMVAKVVWRSGTLFGCSFDQPLSAPELRAVQLRYPLPTNIGSHSDSQTSQAHPLLPDRLRQIREKSGLSRAQLADIAGLSKPSIWAWETGKTIPREASLMAIANALGVSKEKFADGETSHLNHADPEFSEYGENDLQNTIEKSKRILSKVSGVSTSNIKISIEY